MRANGTWHLDHNVTIEPAVVVVTSPLLLQAEPVFGLMIFRGNVNILEEDAAPRGCSPAGDPSSIFPFRWVSRG